MGSELLNLIRESDWRFNDLFHVIQEASACFCDGLQLTIIPLH